MNLEDDILLKSKNYCKILQSNYCFQFPVQHLGEKPFKCPDCDEAFKNSAKLGRHKRTVHTKEKYCCPVCGVEYNCLRSMKRHALKAHGVEHKHRRKNV